MSEYRIYFIAVLIVFSCSCRRSLDDVTENEIAQKVEDLNIPIDFNWDLRQTVEILIELDEMKGYQPKSKISVFNADPDDGGNLYLSGSVAAGNPFHAILDLPPYLSELFVVHENPFGTVTSASVPIQNGVVAHLFSSYKHQKPYESSHYKAVADGPDCDEGCDEYISGSGTYSIKDGKTYCITDDFEGKINFENWNGGGTLRICGTATIKNNQYLTDVSQIVVAEGGHLITSKDIDLSGGSITIYQNATIDIDDVSLGQNAAFTVYEGSVVEMREFDAWGSNAEVINYGSITVEKSSYHAGSLVNHGSLTYEKKLELNKVACLNTGELSVSEDFSCYGQGSSMENQGTFVCDKNFEYGNNTIFTNYGSIYIDEGFSISGNASLVNYGEINIEKETGVSTNGDFTNNCFIYSKDDMEFSGSVNIELNTGYLKSDKGISFWNSQSIGLYNNSMIAAEDFTMECDMIGDGGLSSVVITEDIEVWSSSDKFSGAIEVATTSGQMAGGDEQNFADGAYLTSIEDAVNYLPVSACNPDGFGTPTIVDMDLDGIPDELDDYPNDPLRAFTSYFPDQEQYATVAFEDLWPYKGDYDFNDLVMAIDASYVTNANDLVVDLKFDFTVKAVGASIDNGFGFQYESLTPDMLESVTGQVLEEGYVSLATNGTEEGQAKTVVIVTESIDDVINRPGGSFFNTIPENPQGTSDTIQIVMTFTEPQDPALIDLVYFNPFIIKSKDRSAEIHLPDYPPTDLMDTELFGTGDDASNPVAGTYFVTTANLPWAMFLLEPFDYPIEKVQIIDAYNHFGSWAESGGTLYNDWYLDFSGYRNSEEIY